MNATRPLTALLVVLVLTAGCLGGGADTDPTVSTPTTTAETLRSTTTTTTTATTESTPTATTITTTTVATTPATTTVAFENRTEFHGTVTEVVDGDTFDVRLWSGQTETIRLLGVDTPEVHVENDPAEFEGISTTERGRQWLRTWGEKGSGYAKQTLKGKSVRVVVDEQADRRGSYGRLLAYVYVEDTLFNKKLLTKGYARLYESEFSKRSTFESIERVARAQNRGLWAFEKQESSEDSGSGADGLAVVAIHEDASGNDHENENGEYIRLKNTGGSSIALGGWTVSDSVGHTYSFPNGASLGAGEALTLYTGSGSSGGASYYWGSDSAIWNNGGDTVIVRTGSGEMVVRMEY